MNVRHLMGVLHSFSIKNIFYDKMDLRLYFCVMISNPLDIRRFTCVHLRVRNVCFSEHFANVLNG